MVVPRHPFFDGLRPTLHIAHRGGSLVAPENTLVAFRRAVHEFATDMLEIDVHATHDGVIVVAHDDTVDRCTNGEGPIASKTWAELEQLDAGYRFTSLGSTETPYRGLGVRVPTLASVLREFPGLRFNIELKGTAPGLEHLLAEVVRKAGVARVCVGSEDDGTGRRVVEAMPECCHFYPREALTKVVMALKMGMAADDSEPFTVLDMPLEYGGVRLVDRELVDRAGAMGRWVNVWTIDDRDEMGRLIEAGVGGIMTDRPDLLREELTARR